MKRCSIKLRATRWVARNLGLLILSVLVLSAGAANPFKGHWALTIPGWGAGWLGVDETGGKLTADILWGGGSVLPVDGVEVSGDRLVLKRFSTSGERGAEVVTTETITAERDGVNLHLTTVKSRPGQSEFDRAEFSGRLTPPMPPAPDLTKVEYGPSFRLFNGTNLDGWRLINPKYANGWVVHDGILSNYPVQEKGKPRRSYGNLRTIQDFGDFNLTLEVNVPPGGNSGIYLRGIYEVQVADTHGRPANAHNMGGIYSRIKPSQTVEKPAGQWQTLDITLVDRHVTVILNGTCIIDNQPVPGCTGGALWSDPFLFGPIYLQGDHSGVNYRNIVLRTVTR